MELFAVLAIAGFCIMMVFFLLMAGLNFWLSRSSRRPFTPEETAQIDAAAEAYFAQTIPNLLPWSTPTLAGLSCCWQGERHVSFTTRRHEGWIPSLSHPEGRGPVAFHLVQKGLYRVVHLRTSIHQVRLELEGDEGRVTGRYGTLGKVRLADGTLLDEAGRPLGQYHHQPGRLRLTVGSAPLSSRYGPVELNGRTVAELNDGLVWRKGSWGIFTGEATHRPLIRRLAPDLTDEETDWLLALVGVELIYNARRANRSGRAIV